MNTLSTHTLNVNRKFASVKSKSLRMHYFCAHERRPEIFNSERILK